MLTKSSTFLAYEQAGYRAQFYVYLDSDVSRRCFTVSGEEAMSADTGYYDGSGYVGDGGTYGAGLGTVQTRQLLRSLPVINKTVTQSVRGLLTALSASQVGHVFSEFDNLEEDDGKFYFSNLLTGPNKETFLNHNYEVRMGFPGLPYGDQLSLFQGVIMQSPLNGPIFSVSADGITGTLYDVWEVPKSSRYTNPAQANQAIPVVIGDMTENGDLDIDGDGIADTGVIPLVCIDTVNDVWALACCPLLTTGNGQSITLYDNDGLINSGDYVYTASGDYESTGLNIAYVTFSTPPTGAVTGKYKGAPDTDTGLLITNPILCLEKILDIMDETTLFADTTFQQAVNDAVTNSYTCAGIILADNPKAYWMGNLLGCFLGSWFVDENQEITLHLDTGSDNFLATAGTLDESLLKGPPKLKLMRDNLITRPIINYAISYAKSDRRFKTDVSASYLQTYADTEVTGDISQTVNFDWTRNTATVTAVATRIESLYNPALPVYSAKTTDFSLVHWEPGDFFDYGSRWIYDDEGNPLSGQIGRLLNVVIDAKTREISLDWYDTGYYLLAAPDYYDGAGYVGDGLTYGGERA